MAELPVQIDGYIDDAQPGFVECSFVDANGTLHRFHEKVPVVSSEQLGADSTYPRPGVIACRVVEEWRDVDGAYRVRISTELPFCIESTTGTTLFVVPSTALRTVSATEAPYVAGMSTERLPCHAAPVIVAMGQTAKGAPVTSECPYCASKIRIEFPSDSTWSHACDCGKCNGIMKGL